MKDAIGLKSPMERDEKRKGKKTWKTKRNSRIERKSRWRRKRKGRGERTPDENCIENNSLGELEKNRETLENSYKIHEISKRK